MRYLPRILMLLAAAALVALFYMPLWRIALFAPQFPEGLHMDIWINKISGSSKHILQNINILNHYIGMQFIDENSIPELKYFPMVVLTMVALGVLAVLINRKWAFLGWAVLLTLLAGAAVVDFYLWLYDYGHNLDPHAPIQVPGMVYQPPLIGRKELLNFVAYSYPRGGTIFMTLSMILAYTAFFIKRKTIRK